MEFSGLEFSESDVRDIDSSNLEFIELEWSDLEFCNLVFISFEFNDFQSSGCRRSTKSNRPILQGVISLSFARDSAAS